MDELGEHCSVPQWRLESRRSHSTEQTTGPLQSKFIVDISVGRDPAYYINNCCLVIYIICQVACFAVAVEPSDFGTRSSLTVALLLTLVAFKFVMNGFVPKINYLTLLDIYTAIGLVMLILEIVENFIVALASKTHPGAAYISDIVFNILYAAIWNLFHLFIYLAHVNKWFLVKYLNAQREAVIKSNHSSKGSGDIIVVEDSKVEAGGESQNIATTTVYAKSKQI